MVQRTEAEIEYLDHRIQVVRDEIDERLDELSELLKARDNELQSDNSEGIH